MKTNTRFSIGKQALASLACAMLSTPLVATAVLATILGVATTTVQAACYDDIQSLPCWGPDKKCNIKFRNHTGRASGSGGSEYNQKSQAKTVKAWAATADGKYSNITIPTIWSRVARIPNP